MDRAFPANATSLEAGSFELNGISGVSLARGPHALGIRLIAIHPTLGLYDDRALPLSICTPPVEAPDLSYVRYEWRMPVQESGWRRYFRWPRGSVNAPQVLGYTDEEAAVVTLEWFRDGDIVRGRYTTNLPAARFALVVNGCFAPAKVLSADAAGCVLEQGNEKLSVSLQNPAGIEAPFVLNKLEDAIVSWMGFEPKVGEELVVYPVNLQPGVSFDFALSFAEVAAISDISERLAAGAAAYEESRMRSTGDFADSAEAVAALSAYSRTYDPRRERVQTTINRTWAGTNRPGLVFGWDNFFTSYFAAWENPALAAASLEHIVTVYSSNGIEHGPSQRNLIIPILYVRTISIIGDDELARRTWPGMMKFMRFWFPNRDGNGDGLIEPGSSHSIETTPRGKIVSDAMDETGYDELPIYSAGFAEGRKGMLADGVVFDWKSQTLGITLVCQNSLYIAACRSMAGLAKRLGHAEDESWLLSEADRVAARMKEVLFSEEEGIFKDRHWDGTFSPASVMTTFYPLIAGIADDEVKEALKKKLLDPKQFWGDNMIPTVSRSDAAYCDGLDKKGNYWRGNTWPSSTYIVYLAIKEAGWDEIAYEFAARTYRQFMQYWRKHVHAYENYPPEGDVDHNFLYVMPWGGREIRYVWAAAMIFCGLEEIIGLELDGKLRAGNPFLKTQSGWKDFIFRGKKIQAETGPERTIVRLEKEWTLTLGAGASIRSLEFCGEGLSFDVLSSNGASLEIESGRSFGVSVGKDAATSVTKLDIPAGRHSVKVSF